MKPLLVSTSDRGGAGKACLRLYSGLKSEDINVKVLVRYNTSADPNVITLEKSGVKKSKFEKKLNRIFKELNIFKSNRLTQEDKFIQERSTALEFFSYPKSQFKINESEYFQKANIVNLHWIANFLDYSSFFKNINIPVVWTLHDMNPFFGGEHYNEEYIGMAENGEPITRIRSEREISENEKILNEKKKSLKHVKNLHFVVLNKWMAGEIRKDSFFKRFQIHHIPNGADTTLFKPLDKIFCRNILNLPPNKKILLFVSEYVANTRKGFSFLLKAIELMNNEDFILLAVGKKSDRIINFSNVLELGNIQNEYLMNIAYNASDVFVTPSLIDNSPNTIIESLLCGTPVIGFPTGGIPEMINSGKNGLLTKKISAKSLANTIDRFLSNGVCLRKNEIANQARKIYDVKIQVKKYLDLFKTIASSK